MNRCHGRAVISLGSLTLTLLLSAGSAVGAAPEGQITWAAPFSISPIF
jgi:hypothetical protein